MAVEIVTRIGALAFQLKGAAKATLPWLEPAPFPLATGEFLVARMDEGALTYLVVDHRTHPGAAPVSVEFWEPLDACEGGLGGLFALCDPAAAATPAPAVSSLRELRMLCAADRLT